MDFVCTVLQEFGFSSVSVKFGRPIVVNCVPGSGKSHCIRTILGRDSRFVAATFGKADPINVHCRRIASTSEIEGLDSKYIIIDEYQLGSWEAFDPIAIFGDPCQGTAPCIPPQFISTKTRRFGYNTCGLLQKFGFSIESDQEDEVVIQSSAVGEVEGEVLACGPEAELILTWYGYPYKKYCEVRGSTFEVVTLVTDFSTIPEELRVELYTCLTRHRRKLIIINGDATFAPAGQH
ncbi:triple gene block protein 1 [Coleus vein necrosis virus]|uniref:Triple gene block protein 1 n=1 Tax=Coleus vein necrosis virus TaxID=404404 RepID=A7TZR8_9VIRU|nr:triple gene block protein 1 [Coleus vein necrosis virus]ABS89246.1 triple gene block protein 1 [Coleus vein necrosis virus]